jgi:hypothetical protein
MFIPMSNIRSVELARATGASSTFDFYVHCKDGATHEFSNLSRNEIGPIQDYVRKVKLPQGPAESSSDEEGGGEVKEEEPASDSDDPDDEDFNPVAASEEVQFRRPGASKKRKADAVEDTDTAGAAQGTLQHLQRCVSEYWKTRENVSWRAGKESVDIKQEEEEEVDEESDASDDDDSESDSDSGSVELVSEDEFSIGQLKNMIDAENKPAT